MHILIVGLVIFFAAHSVSIVNEGWRNRMVGKVGEQRWKGLYSLVSLAGLILIIWGYGMARQEPSVVYVPPAWLSHLSLLLLVPVFPLLLAAYLPGRIRSAVGHPMLVGTMLWAVSHLLVNGMLADILLFGSFLAWSAADYLSMRRRTPRTIPGAPPLKWNDAIAIVAGLGIYLAFTFKLHTWLIGVSPVTF